MIAHVNAAFLGCKHGIIYAHSCAFLLFILARIATRRGGDGFARVLCVLAVSCQFQHPMEWKTSIHVNNKVFSPMADVAPEIFPM
jgi:hypothetical protein